MHLLQSGVDISVIALWLGHESIQTIHIYIEPDLATRERALAKLVSPEESVSQFKPAEHVVHYMTANGSHYTNTSERTNDDFLIEALYQRKPTSDRNFGDQRQNANKWQARENRQLE